MLKRLILALVSLSLLSSCGFKLRGSFQIPAELTRISIEGGERAMVEQLTDILLKSGAEVMDSGTDSPTLTLSRSEFKRDVRTTDSDGIATGFDYTYLVEFNVSNAQGDTLLAPSSISQSRTLEYETGNELEFEEEEVFLKKEMEKDIALKIMRRLVRI